MADQKTDVKNDTSNDLSQSLGKGLAQSVNPLEHTIDVQLPGAVRKPDKQVKDLDPSSTLSVPIPKAATLEQNQPTQDLKTTLNVKKQVQSIQVEPSLSSDIEQERKKFSPNLNPSLTGESFSFKPKTGYVDTILDVLMNLLAELLTRIDRMFFRRGGQKQKNVVTEREAELEEFMEASFREFRNKQAMKLATKEDLEEERRKREKNKKAEEAALDQSWQDE